METLVQYLVVALLVSSLIAVWVVIAMAVRGSTIAPEARMPRRKGSYRPTVWKSRTVTKYTPSGEGS